MNTTAKNLLAIVGVVALVGGTIYLVGSKIAGKLGIGKPRLTNIKTDWATYITAQLQIPVTNNNLVPIPTPQFEGGIFYRNYYNLADVRISDPVTLQAKETTILMTNVRISLGDLTKNIVQIIKDKAFLPSLWLKGKVIAGEIKIPVNQNIQII